MSAPVVIALVVASFVIATWLESRRARARQAEPGRRVAPSPQLPADSAAIAPLLAQVSERIHALETERARSTGMLVGQMRELRASGELLRTQASGLERALRQPLARGQWGELQLRRVVEVAGLSEHCRDFTTQAEARTSEQARLRPDMIVNLPNGRCVVIDAKTPLDAYLDAAAAPDDDAAAPHVARHAELVRTHVRQLASKQYASHVDGAKRTVEGVAAVFGAVRRVAAIDGLWSKP